MFTKSPLKVRRKAVQAGLQAMSCRSVRMAQPSPTIRKVDKPGYVVYSNTVALYTKNFHV